MSWLEFFKKLRERERERETGEWRLVIYCSGYGMVFGKKQQNPINERDSYSALDAATCTGWRKMTKTASAP